MADGEYVPTYKGNNVIKPAKTLFMSPIFVKRREIQVNTSNTNNSPLPKSLNDTPTKDKTEVILPAASTTQILKFSNQEGTTQTSKTIIQLAKLQKQLNTVDAIPPFAPDLSHLDLNMVERYSIKPEKEYQSQNATKTKSYNDFQNMQNVKNHRLSQWMNNIITPPTHEPRPCVPESKTIGIGEFTPVLSIHDSDNIDIHLPSHPPHPTREAAERTSRTTDRFINRHFRSQSLVVEDKNALLEVAPFVKTEQQMRRVSTEHRPAVARNMKKTLMQNYRNYQKFPNFCSTSMIESGKYQQPTHNSFMWPTLSSEQKSLKQQVQSVKGLMENKKGTSKIEVPFSNLKPQGVKSEAAARKIAAIYIQSTTTLEEGTTSSVMDNSVFFILNRVKSADFSEALKAISEIIDIASNTSPEMISPYMTLINQRLLELLKSPRSHVARTACQLTGHFFEVMKDTRRPEFDDIVNILLYKTADACKYIRQDANLALDAMVTHIPFSHAVRSICAKGPTHRNPLTRCATIRLLICAIVIAGATEVMHHPKHDTTRKRIYDNLLFFFEDKYCDTRKYAERLYKIMVKEGTFDYFAKKYLNRTKCDALLAVVNTIKCGK